MIYNLSIVRSDAAYLAYKTPSDLSIQVNVEVYDTTSMVISSCNAVSNL